MTLNQLKVFVLVVRLGSFRAAASALGVSEPAVSQALAALRQSLGDQLVTRTGPTLTLTAAGQRVVGLASQMVNLAVAAEDAVRSANGDADLLRVVAVGQRRRLGRAGACSRRSPAGRANVEATLGIATSGEMRALLAERLADVALGPALAGPAAPGVVSEPLLRYRLLVVAGHAHPRPPGSRCARSPPCATRSGWSTRPPPTRSRTSAGCSPASACPRPTCGCSRPNRRRGRRRPAGRGIAPAIEHLWIRDPHPDAAPLAVPGTPIELLWHVSMLEGDRRPAVARRLHRFLATPDATQAMYRADGGVPASRFRPPVYVTLWS